MNHMHIRKIWCNAKNMYAKKYENVKCKIEFKIYIV